MNNNMDEIIVEALHDLAQLFAKEPNRMLSWEIRKEPYSAGIDRTCTITVTYHLRMPP